LGSKVMNQPFYSPDLAPQWCLFVCLDDWWSTYEGRNSICIMSSSMVPRTGYSVRLHIFMLLASVPCHGDGKNVSL
jgi:hypothetical protein